jgi:hypothetical protein
MNTLGRPARARNSFAAFNVLAASYARRGETRNPSIHTAALVEDRPEQIRRTDDISECQFKEQWFTRFPLRESLLNRRIVSPAVLDGVVENGRIGGQTRDREFIDVAFERPSVEQIAGDVVEPEALAEVVQLSGRFHSYLFS